MLPDVVRTRHLAMLGFLKSMLEEADVQAELFEMSDQLPVSVLMTTIGPDSKGRDRTLHFSFIPVDDEDIVSIQLLQLYSTMPYRIESGRREALAQQLLEINGQCPFGHFGISEQEQLYFRYQYAVSASRLFERDEMMEVIGLIIQTIEAFDEQLEQAASG
ncbi:YbjN domain-containing protein [Paenibacillus koleovorans]|uniref:YbjN domain-containing protein n=1 Tax=Paenibacillus koleovorans TaxID=121608 RepID=UPI000FD6CC3F|nr:YbjN domain-containing protein [Paenibacillus koleovorans]